jgi:ATPase subunit of ABC transporter with duplicated ATPase domains
LLVSSSSPVSALVTLAAREISKAFGPRVVLDRVSCIITAGRRVGVVAPNGTGKSTLLRVLAGLEVADAGRVVLTPDAATVGYLPQEPDRRTDESVRAFLARRTGITAVEAALDAASRALADAAAGADDRYARALERYLALGAADFDARVGEVCAQVRLAERLLDTPTSTLSGGEAARASLAAVLLSRFDVVLLDEPTNDLDFAGLEQLEQFLLALPGAAMVVSHDRAFLARTITDVLELDEHTHRAAEFRGGWDAYLEERATARRHAEEAYAGYQATRADLAKRAQREREWSQQGVAKVSRSAETDKHVRHFRTQSSEHLAARARRTDRALERLERNAVDKPWEGWELRMDIAAAPRGGSVVAELTGVTALRGGFVLGPIDLVVHAAERVAIVGANGSGKSTLLALLLGRLAPHEGRARLGPSVIVGEIGQSRRAFDAAATLLDAVLDATRWTPADARSLLAKFGLTAEHVTRPAAELSPGERTRAELAVMSARGVNCLVLDEPTNHLDLPAIEQLEQALDRFRGTLLLVTHDRALLDAVRLTRLIAVDGGCVISDAPVGD